MLDTTTKQKIDSLRNLLVGKVPDPKSQVEQITVALFYKFMWDRDKEIKDLGGNATFFVREFEKYKLDPADEERACNNHCRRMRMVHETCKNFGF